jgi:hypothetical protein
MKNTNHTICNDKYNKSYELIITECLQEYIIGPSNNT